MLVVLRDFDAAQALAAIEAERLTGAWLAPVMLSRVLALPKRGDFDVSSLEWVIGGGERTPAERIRAFASVFPGGRYIDAYGLTESCSGDTFMEAGRQLPAGQAGEICLRGPKLTGGYWRDPARSAASFHDGWFRTGDVGYLDDEGFLYLTDRKKDMVISGGENIASSEIERVLYEHPDIEEVAVVGVPDEHWGERVVAVVVPKAGAAFDLAALQAHCTGRLGGFKIPKQLVLRTELPRNPSGKVLKRVLREELRSASQPAATPPSSLVSSQVTTQVPRRVPRQGEGQDG
jgi:fatty-acyl-CoA synthase